MKNELADVWFYNQGWTAHDFQKQCWTEIAANRSGILNAPTGYGKTLAIWFGVIQQYYSASYQQQISKQRKKGLHALWITPLRALSKEIHRVTEGVSADLDLDYQIELRTGDTSTANRLKQRKNPPQALITTPESVHLLLATKQGQDYFKQLEFIVVDEWHELLGSKRGVLIELALSRLKNINPNLKIWGISATIGNLGQAKDILLGSSNTGVMVKAKINKKITIQTVLPDSLEKFPWAGHLGIRLLDKVVNIVNQYGTTLIFTNTRSQAEIWYQQIISQYPEFAGLLAIHHGSLSDEVRVWVEEALHAGRLKAVVCTSSLDLGVDFRPVDCVIQIGSPKGVARFLQRAGRSGHRPDATSIIYYVPTNSLEIIEGDSLKFAVKEKIVEQRIPYIRSFDVLTQYLMTLAVGDGFDPQQIFAEITQTHCFESVTQEEFDQCMGLLLHGGTSLKAYDDFHRLELIDGLYKVTSRKLAMRHRLSIGAIVSDLMMRVKFLSGKYLGSIEESFISKLNVGDVFWFSGRQLELIQVIANDAIVKASEKKKGVIPSWMGGRFAISPDLGIAIRHSFSNIHRKSGQSEEIKFLQPLFLEQERVSGLPKAEELLVEYTETKYGFHLFIYPFDGKLVHEGMAQVIAYRLGQITPATFSIATNEYGIELLSDTAYELNEQILKQIFSPANLHADINSGINVQEMARRRFRDIAGIAGLVFQGFPGKQMKSKHLQANAALFFSVFSEYESNNLLLRESYDEVFDFQLEEGRMMKAFERIDKHQIIFRKPDKLTPFAFPIFSESFRERYSNEDWQSKLEKIKLQLIDG
ncbi:ligase-associated DNA damage response DEXH box helicase [Sphingobacterium sp. DK4209]|uniref:Ligase-associated DNA damage response DEXH box helicase n=1 Tax=Sphingobacterium zhuxiongii TaxID=2662364 RepID=A0A5Q0QBT9_9SPHI|nr:MULTISPECIES: ligase-associated DNA damage response DEXH box helicase [unclassified Sphingobacterium]MVZ66933.1 ligase-associated DNA damage response DEXH box helicase [Sphingobacterium sp. DK4209]QGA26649.1 ligase-associated DNA damage response DEXH box helicase [Sphingobacterium sp. dk4302]